MLDSARHIALQLMVEGHLEATPLSRFTVELFANSPGDAEGDVFLGAVAAATDANGYATFSFTTPAAPGMTFTATATSSDGATSEFSQPLAAFR